MPTAEDFEAAGLYDPVLDVDGGQLGLLHWLDAEGFTIEEMQRANDISSMDLASLPTDRLLRAGELVARSEALELSGLSPDDFDEAANAVGMVPVDDAPEGEIGFTADDARTLAALGTLMSMFSRDEAMAALRVVGSSVARIAEASVSLFLQDIESPHIKAGGSELVNAQQSHEAAGLLESSVGANLNSLLRRHAIQAIERTRGAAIGDDERFEYRYAVGFVDLVGFTALSADMSPQELGVFVREFEGRAHQLVTAAGARVVKLIGDEVMLVSPNADAACLAANDLLSGFEFFGRDVIPRGGLAYGNVLLRGGDYYGSVVNLASRLVDEAVPQELLVTDEVARAATGCEFEPAGRRMVKGFSDPVLVKSFLNG
ncbi:MAG: hypothetical protein GY724_02920 [Actinomycetia bacterium]|nr:hypothetical protein [Actinomycetes bacterium]MCP4227449.1 hypothetical protein [Actinomycetes bacterium]MCP5030685.1 hypothetical protein [Actinomycetes bacterium]